MQHKDSDIEWQKDAPVLASMSRLHPFTVPAGYFETLSEQVKAKALIESERFQVQDEFSLPEHYFDQLTQKINSRIAVEGVLSEIKGEGFTVPDGYFNSLSSSIQSKVTKKKSYWFSYAAAACISMIIGSVIYLNLNSSGINRELSGVPDQEIINYLQLHSTVADNQYIIDHLSTEELQQVNNNISTGELELYINNTTL